MTFAIKLEKLYILLLTFYHLRPGCLGYDPEASITGLYTGPYFDPLAPRNLTAHLGDRAVLPCTVRQLGDKSVSWVRMRDADILTVDRYTFVSDERFEAHYSPPLETWNLIIKYVQERDAGQYECQVSTEPKMSQLFNLRVVVPRVSMLPPGDRYVKAGSKVRIDCQITDVVQQPDYIFWYHEGIRVLENQDTNLAVIVKKTGDESMMSTLTISRVRRDESGNYTCMPSNLHSSSVLLHVLNEEHPEAMKDGRNASCKMEQPIYLFLLFVLCTTLGYLFNDGALPDKNNGGRKSMAVKKGFQLANYADEGKQRLDEGKKSQKSTNISEDLMVRTNKLEMLTEIASQNHSNLLSELNSFLKNEADAISKIIGDNNDTISIDPIKDGNSSQLPIQLPRQLTRGASETVSQADKAGFGQLNKETLSSTSNEIQLTYTSIQNETAPDMQNFKQLLINFRCYGLLDDKDQASNPKSWNVREVPTPDLWYNDSSFKQAQNFLQIANVSGINNSENHSLGQTR